MEKSEIDKLNQFEADLTKQIQQDLQPSDPPQTVIQCCYCQHFRSYQHWTCDAFPNGIPQEILGRHFDHTKPYKGDHGIQFEDQDRDTSTSDMF